MHCHVDFSHALGPIKPLHGVGQPPTAGSDFSMFHSFMINASFYINVFFYFNSEIFPENNSNSPLTRNLP